MTTRHHKHNHKPVVRVIPETCGKRRYSTQGQANRVCAGVVAEAWHSPADLQVPHL